jgi:hypothetical protein
VPNAVVGSDRALTIPYTFFVHDDDDDDDDFPKFKKIGFFSWQTVFVQLMTIAATEQ